MWLWLLFFDNFRPQSLNFVSKLDENPLIKDCGPDVIEAFELLGVLLGHVERNRVIKQEGVRDVILGVALQVKNDSELVVNLVFISHLFKFVCNLLPKLREPNGGHEYP